MGQGEWAAAKHGGKGKRGWKKLHLSVDATGEIVAQSLTNSNVDDGTVGVAIIDDLRDRIQSVTADAAYDMKPIYDAAESKGAEVIVPVLSQRCADALTVAGGPHLSIGNRVLDRAAEPRSTSLGLATGHERLGGLLRHYRASD